MEKEPPSLSPKLVEVVARDFPAVSEVLVSFPDQWELVQSIDSGQNQLYIAGLPISRAWLNRDHFHGLAPEINVSLVFYRLYKFFRPSPMPGLRVTWNDQIEEGGVSGVDDLKIQLQPMGQAQAWFGASCAVLWECYFHETYRGADWRRTLCEVWRTVETDLQVPKIFTLPCDPAYQTGYNEFLSEQGYTVDSENPEWWSKDIRAK